MSDATPRPPHPTVEALRRLRRNRFAWACLWFLGLMYAAALLAPFLAPYAADSNDLGRSYCPPSRLRFVDKDGKFHLQPFIYSQRVADRLNSRYEEDTSTRYPVRFLPKGEPYRLFGLIPADRHLFGVDAPARLYLLGSDQLGRDVLSRLLVGAQVSLFIGLVGILIVYPLGLLVGGISGYYGGTIDFVTMRIAEVIMAVPGFYLLLSLRNTFPDRMSSVQIFLMITLIISFISWAGFSRVIRGMVLAEREKPYVAAARALGQSNPVIIFRHILPSTFSYCLVAATLTIPGYIMGEAALSYIGIGITEPDASWGLMLAQAQSYRVLVSFWWILSPGFLIFLVVLAFNFLGDGLRDALDPKMKGAGR